MNSPITSLIESAHGAVYAYGVIAAYAPDSTALDDMATHRRMRDELIKFAQDSGVVVPPALPSYQLPLPVRDAATAQAAATTIENLMCATWAHALSRIDSTFAAQHVQFPIECALRAYSYTLQYFAFPS